MANKLYAMEQLTEEVAKFSSVMERQQLWKMPNAGKHVWRKKKQQKKQLGEQKQKVESMENWRKPRRRSKQKGQIQSQRIGRKTLPQYYNEK